MNQVFIALHPRMKKYQLFYGKRFRGHLKSSYSGKKLSNHMYQPFFLEIFCNKKQELSIINVNLFLLSDFLKMKSVKLDKFLIKFCFSELLRCLPNLAMVCRKFGHL